MITNFELATQARKLRITLLRDLGRVQEAEELEASPLKLEDYKESEDGAEARSDAAHDFIDHLLDAGLDLREVLNEKGLEFLDDVEADHS